jgi:cytochrome c oxidase subunit II
MVLIGVLTGIGVALIAYLVPWLPERASKEADQIDRVFWFTTFICIAIFAIVAAVSVYAGLKFRAASDDPDDGAPIHGHTGLEIVWTIVPAVLVTAISVYSGLVLIDIENVADDAPRIEVTAQQFAWSYAYPGLDGVTSGELVLEVDEPVVLTLTSKDVIHSFWVPEWRVKQDAVPGVETRLVVTPTKVGRFPIRCTELCGLGHATMLSRALVLSSADFDKWVQEQQAAAGGEGGEAASGKDIFDEQGCGTCHTLADAGSTAQTGPDLDKVLSEHGHDAEHIRESIVDPNAEIAQGFQPDVMPQNFDEKLSDAQLDALVDYLVEATKGG